MEPPVAAPMHAVELPVAGVEVEAPQPQPQHHLAIIWWLRMGKMRKKLWLHWLHVFSPSLVPLLPLMLSQLPVVLQQLM